MVTPQLETVGMGKSHVGQIRRDAGIAAANPPLTSPGWSRTDNMKEPEITALYDDAMYEDRLLPTRDWLVHEDRFM